MNESKSSGNSDKPRSNRRRRPNNRNRNNPNKKAGPKTAAKTSEGGSNNKNKNSNRNRNRNRNNRNRNRKGPKLSGFEKVERGYINLLEVYMNARRKYFELFHRANPQQLQKLEKNFNKSRNELRDYETHIEPQYIEEFNQKFNGHRIDTTYSSNHQLGLEGDDFPPQSMINDPHYLVTQKENTFKDDTEESTGSLEDYKAYKGL